MLLLGMNGDGDSRTHRTSLLCIMGQWEDSFIATLVHWRSTYVLQLHLAYIYIYIYIYIVCTVEVGNKFLFYSEHLAPIIGHACQIYYTANDVSENYRMYVRIWIYKLLDLCWVLKNVTSSANHKDIFEIEYFEIHITV